MLTDTRTNLQILHEQYGNMCSVHSSSPKVQRDRYGPRNSKIVCLCLIQYAQWDRGPILQIRELSARSSNHSEAQVDQQISSCRYNVGSAFSHDGLRDETGLKFQHLSTSESSRSNTWPWSLRISRSSRGLWVRHLQRIKESSDFLIHPFAKMLSNNMNQSSSYSQLSCFEYQISTVIEQARSFNHTTTQLRLCFPNGPSITANNCEVHTTFT